MEVRLWHAALDDHIDASATTQWRDAKDQRSLSVQRVRGGIACGDGTRRGPAPAQALPGGHGHRRPVVRIARK